MLKRLFFIMVAVTSFVFGQQAINVGGKVLDEEGKPVSSATVALRNAGIQCLTDTSGNFTLLYNPTGALNAYGKLFYPKPVLTSGVLFFSIIENNTHVQIDIFNITGKKVLNISKAGYLSGNYTLNIGSMMNGIKAIGYYLIRVNINGIVTTYPQLFMSGVRNSKPQALSSMAGILKKTAGTGIIDTITINKTGFIPYRQAITQYVGSLDSITIKFVPVISPLASIIDSGTIEKTATVSVGGDTIVFNASLLTSTTLLDTLSAGHILIIPSTTLVPEGMIRKVVSANKIGSQYVFITEQASLTDVIKTGSIDTTVSLTADNIFDSTNNLKKTAGTGTIQVTFDHATLYKQDANSTVWASGSIEISPSFNFHFLIKDYSLSQLDYVGKVNNNISITFGASTTMDIFDSTLAKVLLKKIKFKRIKFIIPTTIPFPVWITPVLDIYSGLTGKTGVDITAGFTYSNSFTAGIKYGNNQWTQFDSSSQSFTCIPPKISVNISMQGYVQPQMNLMIYGVAGPYIAAKGHLDANGDLLSNPLWWLDCGLDISAGAKIQIFQKTLADKSFMLFKYSKPLAEAGPRNLVAKSLPDSSIALNWSTFNNAGSFNVYAATSPLITIGNYSALPNGIKYSSVTNPYTAMNLLNDTTYYFIVTANDTAKKIESFASDTVSEMTSDTVVDIDGNVYHTIKIGTQIWMVENLKTTRLNDGTPIPLVMDSAAWVNLKTPGYCWYNNNISFKDPYGALYHWYAVNTGKLAPAGWHVPTDSEWTVLTTFCGGKNVGGGVLKDIGTTYWTSPNTGATNQYGFSALPGGFRNYNIDRVVYQVLADAAFAGIGDYGGWWSSTAAGATATTTFSLGCAMACNSALVSHTDNPTAFGISVRCVKN